jgi:hypothetical protein
MPSASVMQAIVLAGSHHPACSGGWHQLAFNFINLDIIDATTTIITPEPAAIGTGPNALITNRFPTASDR